MEEFNIVSARKRDDWSITLTIDDPISEALIERRFADIRMGVHWPTALSPACFIVVGQDFLTDKRFVIAEHVSESFGMAHFYKQIVITAEKMICRNLYAILPDERNECGYLVDLEEYAYNVDCSIYVEPDEGENFFLNIARTKDCLENGSLSIPENTVVFDQLSTITRDDLGEKPEERFFAIDALGHVLDGFYRMPPRNEPYVKRPLPPY